MASKAAMQAFFQEQRRQHAIKQEPDTDDSLFLQPQPTQRTDFDVDINHNQQLFIPPPPPNRTPSTTTTMTPLGFQSLGISINPAAATHTTTKKMKKTSAPTTTAIPTPKKQKLTPPPPVPTRIADVDEDDDAGLGEDDNAEHEEQGDITINTSKAICLNKKHIKEHLLLAINRPYADWMGLPLEEKEHIDTPKHIKHISPAVVDKLVEFLQDYTDVVVDTIVKEAETWSWTNITHEYVEDTILNAARDAAKNQRTNKNNA
jgi:hypothetical protein